MRDTRILRYAALGIILALFSFLLLPWLFNNLQNLTAQPLGLPSPSPLVAVSSSREEVATYTVHEGDSLFGIAERFGLRPETILMNNFEVLRGNSHNLVTGQVLIILPIDGIYYEVKESDTLFKVASDFSGDPQAIVDYPGNHLKSGDSSFDKSKFVPGVWIIIPGGKR